MNVLEKIFEEVEAHAIEFESFGMCDDYVSVGWVKGIIRSHMDDVTDANDDWIPVEDGLPEESLNSVIGWDEYRKRSCFVQYWRGRWILGNDIETVKITAWRPLPKPYKPKEDIEDSGARS